MPRSCSSKILFDFPRRPPVSYIHHFPLPSHTNNNQGKRRETKKKKKKRRRKKEEELTQTHSPRRQAYPSGSPSPTRHRNGETQG